MFMLEPYAPKNQMESLPLHLWVLHRSEAIINRSHALFHSTILTAMIYYRASSLLYTYPTATPILPWLLVFASELLLSFIWLLRQAFRWRPISRTVFPERLPDEKELPAIDVFICTADPKKEPAVEVMNTVLSAMALDYPPEKLSIYLSDDGGSSDTLSAIREAWCFAARWWLPFCRMYGIKTGSPEAYFSAPNDDHAHSRTTEFVEEREKIGRKYQLFKERLTRAKENGSNIMISQNRPPVIEVINDDTIDAANTKMPLLVYVSREKRPSHPHHFKAGALNVLLRVSSIISNSPYILVLDCDMYCNDTTSPRQAMCFHLDPKISPSLAFVQFPQKFHNISENDIYDSQLRSVFLIKWYAMDGLRGPILSGTGFYIKREALYGSVMQEDKDLLQLKKLIGPSNELIISMRRGYQSNVHDGKLSSTLLQETQFLASCTYEKHTHWGQQIGFFYNSVVEDYFTGFMLHCKGWTSVYCNPSRPAFLGCATTNLNDLLVQNTRWYSGLFEVFLSRFCPLIYGLSRMSVLESMCYGFCAFQPLYFLALWCLATIPQLCLLNGIPIYPKVSNSCFVIFTFVFLSSLLKPLEEVLFTGGSIQIWWNELRIWMMKSVTAYFYGSLDAILKWFGMREASFLPTNKVVDDEQVKRYQMGKFDFQTSTMLLAPMVTLVILNMASLVMGVVRVIVAGGWDEMFGQIFLSFFIVIVNYPIIEGMILRKDKGCIPFSVTLLCVVFSIIFLSVGSILLMC